jgi:formiminotetrahydrofolate cyclodeaminase
VFLEVERRARERGVAIARSELVGLVPAEAIQAAGAELLRLEGFVGGERVLERRLAALLPPSPSGQLSHYLDAIAAPGHAPGGGSAGALAAALGHACFEKARALSVGKTALDLDALVKPLVERPAWLAMAGADERSFAEYAASWALPRGDPKKRDAAQANVDSALAVARAAAALAEASARLAREGNANLVNDAAIGAELALAAVRGARWNALATRKKDSSLRTELDGLLVRAETAAREARAQADV